MKAALAVGLMLAAGPAAAQEPPLWANLAKCNAVFRAVSLADGYGDMSEEQIAAAQAAATAFRARAVEGAAKVGQARAEADVASIIVYLEPRWENRIDELLSINSNLHWIGYCGRLGRQEGVLTPDFAP